MQPERSKLPSFEQTPFISDEELAMLDEWSEEDDDDGPTFSYHRTHPLDPEFLRRQAEKSISFEQEVGPLTPRTFGQNMQDWHRLYQRRRPIQYPEEGWNYFLKEVEQERQQFVAGIKELGQKNPTRAAATFMMLSVFDANLKTLLDRAWEAPDQLNQEEVARILEANDRYHREMLPSLEEDVLGVAHKVREQLVACATRGIIPINEATARTKIDQVQLVIVDELTGQIERFAGRYHSEMQPTIVVQPSVLFASAEAQKNRVGRSEVTNLECTLMHEYLHALSGHTIVQELASFPDGQTIDSYHGQRIGLSYECGFGRFARGQARFHWLNEAATETLTGQILDLPDERRAYADERRLLKSLCAGGRQPIDRDLLVAAYFEDVGPGQPPAAWKKLIASVSQSYYPRCLQELDAVVQRSGLRAAFQWLQERQHSVQVTQLFDVVSSADEWEEEATDPRNFDGRPDPVTPSTEAGHRASGWQGFDETDSLFSREELDA